MASATKEYKIVINGIKETIDAVSNLTVMLEKLEQRVDSLNKKGITIKATGSVDTAALKEQDALERQILSTEEKIDQARDKDYQTLIKLKDELKQAKVEAEGLAASSKLMDNNYSDKTMAGLKEQLKDIKRVINTTEIDSPMFKQLVEEANTINNKLKEIEAQYGQFGRNVGNYESAFKGLKAIKLDLNGTAIEFSSIRQATIEIRQQMSALEQQGKRGTEEYKKWVDLLDQVEKTQARINADQKAAQASSHMMNDILSTTKSFVAIASATKGLSSVFGFDNEKADEALKKLMALQTALNGLETIQQQLVTNSGLAKIFNAGGAAIDKFSTNLFGAKKAAEGAAAGMKTATKASKAFSVALKGMGIGLIISLLVTLVSEWDKIDAAITKAIPGLEKFGGVLGGLKGILKGVGNAIVHWFVTPVKTMIDVVKKFKEEGFSGAAQAFADGVREQFAGTVDAFNEGMQDQIDERKREVAKALAEELKMEMDMLEAKYGADVKYTKQYIELQKRRNQAIRDSIDTDTDEGKKAKREQDIEEAKQQKALKDHAKEMAKLQREADKELIDLKIANMKEGLNKTITQLEEERRVRIEKARETGRNVREMEAEINRLYDQKELEARKEYADKVVETYRSMLDAIKQLQADYEKETLANMETELDNTLNSMMQGRMNIIGEGFGTGWGKKRTMPELFTYGTDMKLGTLIDEGTIKKAEEYREILNNVYHALNEVRDAEQMAKDLQGTDESGVEYYKKEAETLRKEYEKALEAKKAFEEANSENIGRIYYAADDKKIDENIFKKRMETLEDFYENYLNVTKDSQERILQQRKVSLEREEELELTELGNRGREYVKQLIKAREAELQGEEMTEEKKLEIKEKYGNLFNDYFAAYVRERKAIQDRYNQEQIKAEQETNQKIQSINEEHWQDMLQQLRDFQSVASRTASKNPVYNSWGIYNFSANKKNFDDARTQYDTLLNDLSKRRQQLNQDWEEGIISDEAFETTGRELDRMVEATTDALAQIEEDASQGFPRFMESIQQYVQAFSQTLTSILEAVWAAQDAAYEMEKEQLEEEAEEYEEMLQKQKEATEKYKDSINSIEDELSTARGDRRQELIDRLNAEKAAQRESLKEEKRIAKEQEKLEEKKDKLDKEQKQREQKRDIITALINASLAVSYAAVNHWPLPAIPMMAAAAAQGAAQVAAISAKKYATGGVIEGKSHAHGGVKVLGGRAEVEGGEYIVNKRTTAKNAPLLSYINAKDKKIELEDIVDFYGSGVRRVVHAVSPQRKFADGGQIPLLRDDLTINDRLLDAFERYSERPVQVAVTEINDVQDDIRRVEVLAGAR